MKHTTPLDHSHDRNMLCALCQAYGRTNMIMIPSHYQCPPGWIIMPRPIMLKFLPIMLLSSAQKTHPLCSILCP